MIRFLPPPTHTVSSFPLFLGTPTHNFPNIVQRSPNFASCALSLFVLFLELTPQHSALLLKWVKECEISCTMCTLFALKYGGSFFLLLVLALCSYMYHNSMEQIFARKVHWQLLVSARDTFQFQC